MRFFRRKEKKPNNINRQLPEYWKFEVFYFNKKDESIVVPNRYGVGFALNYGHKVVQAGAIILGVLVVAMIVALFVL